MTTKKTPSTTPKDDTAIVCNPFDPDYITKIIDAIAVNIASNAASRKAFAKIIKHHSNGTVLLLTDKEIERIIKKRTKG